MAEAGLILGPETYAQKAWRLSKENPFVPIGSIATVGAFVMATVRWQQGNSRSLNLWLRGRVAAHLFTVCAAVYTMYAVGQMDPAKRQQRAEEIMEERKAKVLQQLRPGFEDRLKNAEENHDTEAMLLAKYKKGITPNAVKQPAAATPAPAVPAATTPQGSSWWSVLGWTKKSDK